MARVLRRHLRVRRADPDGRLLAEMFFSPPISNDFAPLTASAGAGGKVLYRGTVLVLPQQLRAAAGRARRALLHLPARVASRRLRRPATAAPTCGATSAQRARPRRGGGPAPGRLGAAHFYDPRYVDPLSDHAALQLPQRSAGERSHGVRRGPGRARTASSRARRRSGPRRSSCSPATVTALPRSRTRPASRREAHARPGGRAERQRGASPARAAPWTGCPTRTCSA